VLVVLLVRCHALHTWLAIRTRRFKCRSYTHLQFVHTSQSLADNWCVCGVSERAACRYAAAMYRITSLWSRVPAHWTFRQDLGVTQAVILSAVSVGLHATVGRECFGRTAECPTSFPPPREEATACHFCTADTLPAMCKTATASWVPAAQEHW
jgi:hypothetical protein